MRISYETITTVLKEIYEESFSIPFASKMCSLSGKHISHTNSSVKLKIKLSFTECEGGKWIRVTILMEVNLQGNIVLMAVVFLLLPSSFNRKQIQSKIIY